MNWINSGYETEDKIFIPVLGVPDVTHCELTYKEDESGLDFITRYPSLTQCYGDFFYLFNLDEIYEEIPDELIEAFPNIYELKIDNNLNYYFIHQSLIEEMAYDDLYKQGVCIPLNYFNLVKFFLEHIYPIINIRFPINGKK